MSLVNLDCSCNQLTNLDVSSVVGLQKLLCHDNKLTVLDISHNQKLSAISCRNNDLSDLDLKKVREATVEWVFKCVLCGRDVTFYVGRTDFLTDVAKL
jgi:Leucine-rich repeat (LRR) protein